jgi:UDP-N-acetyl-D-galactosamine dehydrogenase
MLKNKNIIISVIGMGYVGLPLANSLANNFKTIGYDINKGKILKLKNGEDETKENKKINKKLIFSSNFNDLKKTNVFILCLPTPVDKHKKPDLSILTNCLKSLNQIIKNQDTIILESTFYPGTTENLVTKYINNKNKKINIGYSPERINPGDKKNTIKNITKVISANNNNTLLLMKKIYGSLNNNNIFVAESIRVAEAAKLIENVQRDLNIGLMNELTKIFNKSKISIHDVLEASNTKWNFLKFRPGLVGGHCIGVDPYYLKLFCKKLNFEPKVFMSARNTNENMIFFYKNVISKYLDKKKKILYLGIAFKENTNDLRNSKYFELMKILSQKYLMDIFDPVVKYERINFRKKLIQKKPIYDVIILAVPHKKVMELLKNNINSLLKKNGLFIDLNYNFKQIDKKKYNYITL